LIKVLHFNLNSHTKELIQNVHIIQDLILFSKFQIVLMLKLMLLTTFLLSYCKEMSVNSSNRVVILNIAKFVSYPVVHFAPKNFI